MSHDPRAVEVLAEYRGEAEARDSLKDLTAANLAVIEVGTVPPWMERVAERAHLSGDETWWYGDEDYPIADYLPGHQPLYIIRKDKP